MSTYGERFRALDYNSDDIVRGAADGHSRLARYARCCNEIASEIDAYNMQICGFGKSVSADSAKDLAKTWVRHCRSVGILPWSWLPVWWIVRIWLIPVLERLAIEWLASMSSERDVTWQDVSESSVRGRTIE